MGIKRENEQNTLPFVLGAAVMLVFLFHLVRYVFPDIWGGIYTVYYSFLVPVLTAFTVYFRRGEWEREEKLFLLFWAWVFVSRLLNGDFYLTKDADMVLNTGMAYVFLVICLALKGKRRQRLLDGVSLAVIAFYSLIALACLCCVLLRKELYNPLTGTFLCGFYADSFRLTVFGKNPNECTMWFFLAFYMIVYQFLRQKSWWLRVPLLLAAVLNYIILGMTFSRNGMLAFSACFGLLIVILALQKLSLRKLGTKLLVTAALLAVFTPAAYSSFGATATAMNRISGALVWAEIRASVTDGLPAKSEENSAEMASAPISETQDVAVETQSRSTAEDNMYIDTRGFGDSGRIAIYKSIIPTMQQEPLRLLRGCLCLDVMKISNTVLPKVKPHFHNTFLQLFCLTGLPGLVLILAFCGLLAVRILRLFFSDAPIEVKALTLILIGTFSYNLLEVSLFVAADPRAFTAYIVAGAVLAYDNEMYPRTGEKASV